MSTELVWHKFSEYLRNFISSKISNRADVDDVLQNVFTKIHLNLSNLKDETKLQSWVFQITRNAINDNYKSSKKEIFIENNEETKEDNCFLCLDHIIDDLPENYKVPLRLADIENKKQKEVAKQLGLSLSATKSRVQRAREMLKQEFINCCKFSKNEEGKLVGGKHIKDDCSKCFNK